ncbi:nucleoside hydrolase [Alkalicoccobacillus porphyridii]|uniref:Nucleoside hydrolase n=1 Tax=Alkalicoccobacillus porphyridii TaxID=2597270 RepID=A0A554A408_9BACI|nr:nucleoside hydrolase [Alkalicoccobacillus porphyridii]TSB48417.1 nucleoside hydrolase [Alkalicoccobacillus porphyridii]
MVRKVVLDVDTGVDDALGILLAVHSPELEVQAITTVNGNVSLSTATLNTCKIVEMTGQTSIPVIPGANQPLKRVSYFEHRIHGVDGIGGALKDMVPVKQPESAYAPDAIIHLAKTSSEPLTLIMTGPMTNLAEALQKCPELPTYIDEVIYMGGAALDMGNVTPVAEYNMYVDPEAAWDVLQAGFKKLTQVGLDITRKALLTEDHLKRLDDTKYGAYVRESTSDYMKRYSERNGVKACAMHDPLAVATAIQPNLIETKHLYVDIETNSDLCDGQTVCDFQGRLAKKPNAHVGLHVDAEAFLDLFVRTISLLQEESS